MSHVTAPVSGDFTPVSGDCTPIKAAAKLIFLTCGIMTYLNKNCTVQLERLHPDMFTVQLERLDPEIPQTQKKEVSSGKYTTQDRERNKKKSMVQR
jgi:hypothetical protein